MMTDILKAIYHSVLSLCLM